MIVLDASAAVALALDEMPSDEAQVLLTRITENGALVPPLWDQEVSNALLMAERRGRLTQAETEEAITLLDRLPIELTEDDPSMHELVSSARQFGLTTYDALYLLIAMKSGWALATRDTALRAAARSAGVELA